MNIIRSIPVADQVNEVLRGRMRDGTYKPGERLSSESELSKEFGVSRATVRTVLARLEAEGLILRKQGDGTYINERIQDVNTHLGGLWEFSRLIESSGYQASIKSLAVDKRLASEEEASELAIQPGEEVLSLTRLFYADRKPVILVANAIPYRFIDQVNISSREKKLVGFSAGSLVTPKKGFYIPLQPPLQLGVNRSLIKPSQGQIDQQVL